MFSFCLQMDSNAKRRKIKKKCHNNCKVKNKDFYACSECDFLMCSQCVSKCANCSDVLCDEHFSFKDEYMSSGLCLECFADYENYAFVPYNRVPCLRCVSSNHACPCCRKSVCQDHYERCNRCYVFTCARCLAICSRCLIDVCEYCSIETNLPKPFADQSKIDDSKIDRMCKQHPEESLCDINIWDETSETKEKCVEWIERNPFYVWQSFKQLAFFANNPEAWRNVCFKVCEKMCSEDHLENLYDTFDSIITLYFA